MCVCVCLTLFQPITMDFVEIKAGDIKFEELVGYVTVVADVEIVVVGGVVVVVVVVVDVVVVAVVVVVVVVVDNNNELRHGMVLALGGLGRCIVVCGGGRWWR